MHKNYDQYFTELNAYKLLCNEIYNIQMRLKKGLVCYVPGPNYPTNIGWTDNTTLFYTTEENKKLGIKTMKKDEERLSHLLRVLEKTKIEVNTLYGQSSLNYC